MSTNTAPPIPPHYAAKYSASVDDVTSESLARYLQKLDDELTVTLGINRSASAKRADSGVPPSRSANALPTATIAACLANDSAPVRSQSTTFVVGSDDSEAHSTHSCGVQTEPDEADTTMTEYELTPSRSVTPSECGRKISGFLSYYGLHLDAAFEVR